MWVVVYRLIRNKIGHKLMQALDTNWRWQQYGGHKLTLRRDLQKKIYIE